MATGWRISVISRWVMLVKKYVATFFFFPSLFCLSLLLYDCKYRKHSAPLQMQQKDENGEDFKERLIFVQWQWQEAQATGNLRHRKEEEEEEEWMVVKSTASCHDDKQRVAFQKVLFGESSYRQKEKQNDTGHLHTSSTLHTHIQIGWKGKAMTLDTGDVLCDLPSYCHCKCLVDSRHAMPLPRGKLICQCHSYLP